MMRTRVTELLGIKYPIIQGGMQWLSDAPFAAAVSNGGGLGIITAMSFDDEEALRAEIRKCRELTEKPFGVNVSMLPVVMEQDRAQAFFDVVVEEKVAMVETAGRNPAPYLPRLKEAGIKVMHKVPAVRFAKKAEEVGVDLVAIVGFECAGHPGMDDVTTLILLQKASRELTIPIVAGGGFCDGRGLVAALALGAEAILMGTRFLMTRECWAHPRIKEALLGADERSTVTIERSIRNTARVLDNRASQKTLDLEGKGATLDELMTVISGRLGRKAYAEGDPDVGVIPCGQVIGLVNEIKSVKEVIEEIVREGEAVYEHLAPMFK
jgi:NAD(P)H-dependent flavin oxidoreductase YrpB (nitropropane dioxygenase family)